MRKLTAVRLDPQQVKALEKIGKREDRSMSWLIRKAVDEFLKHAQSGKKETS
jgi:predicted transcriptional regulator